MTSPVQWGTFFHQCLLHRIDANEFRNLSKLLLQKCPIAETALLDALLQTRSESRIKWDPLLPLYIDCLCRTGRVRTSTVLTSLLKYSSIHDKPQLSTSEGKDGSKCYTLMTDIRVIQDTMLSVSTGVLPKLTQKPSQFSLLSLTGSMRLPHGIIAISIPVNTRVAS